MAPPRRRKSPQPNRAARRASAKKEKGSVTVTLYKDDTFLVTASNGFDRNAAPMLLRRGAWAVEKQIEQQERGT